VKGEYNLVINRTQKLYVGLSQIGELCTGLSQTMWDRTKRVANRICRKQNEGLNLDLPHSEI